MIRTKPRIAALVYLLAAVALVWTFPAQATVLTFDIFDSTDTIRASSAGANGPLDTGPHAAYGDNVTSDTMSVGAFTYHYGSKWGFTPDIAVAYSDGGTDVSRYYNDTVWPGADYLESPGGASRLFYWTFTPASGKGVRINSFELFSYSGESHSGTWTIYKDSIGGNVLDSGAFAFSGPTLYSSPLLVTTAQLDYLGSLVLEVNHASGSGGAFALDDLAFNQEIPEPSSAILLLAGVTLIWIRRGMC